MENAAAAGNMDLLYIPERLTPLAWTPLYAGLSPEDRVAYNRLHGCYFMEQIIFFEQVMGGPVLRWMQRHAPEGPLRQAAVEFEAEENRHSGWFRNVLRELDPLRYSQAEYSLLAAPPALQGLMSWTARRVKWLPALLWLQLMAEERALYFGRAFLADAAVLEPRLVLLQRQHLADEAGHVRWDEMFLHWLWRETPQWRRRLNARWLEWMIREFFYLPRRSGWRVVEAWLEQRPHLQARREECRAAMQDLARNEAFLHTLYPRRHLPRTAELAAEWPELAFVQRLLTD